MTTMCTMTNTTTRHPAITHACRLAPMVNPTIPDNTRQYPTVFANFHGKPRKTGENRRFFENLLHCCKQSLVSHLIHAMPATEQEREAIVPQGFAPTIRDIQPAMIMPRPGHPRLLLACCLGAILTCAFLLRGLRSSVSYDGKGILIGFQRVSA
jgi:hypothetical protein